MGLQRVVLTIGQLQLGGTERQVALLAEGLRRRGIEVTVISLFEGGPRADEMRATGIPVLIAGLPRLRRDPRNLLNLARYGRVLTWLRTLRPQVVHAFLYHAYVLTPPAARGAGVPVLVAGRRSLADFKNGSRLAFGLERVATRMTDLIVANCEAVRDDTIRQERLNPDKIVVVRNGLPPSAFADRVPADLGTRSPVVLCVANLIGYKGHRYLLKAATILRRRGVDFSLVLVGDGPQRGRLERLAAELQLPARFLGARSDVPALLAAADIVVLASLHEGLSNSLLEAMAAGKPVVATDVGGNREALDEAGLIVPPADTVGLASAMERLLRNPELARRLGDLARRRASTVFPIGAMVDQHIEIYESLYRRCAG